MHFHVDYPDRELNRLTTGLRLFTALPIVILLGAVTGSSNGGVAGLLFFAPLLMILFRQRYPGWWFAWNVELLRFSNRVAAYVLLMDDRYPSTEDHQAVHLDVDDPGRDVPQLNRWLPLVKWLLAIPHYVVLALLWIGVLGAVIAAWFAILFTGRYPRGLFHFAEGVLRWQNRVVAYAIILTTDAYPPFRLAP